MATRRMWFTYSAAVTISSALGFAALVLAQIQLGVPLSEAAGLSGLPLALWIWAAVLYARTNWSSWIPSRGRQRLQLLLWSAMIGVATAVLLNPLAGPGIAGLSGVAVGLLGWRRYRGVLARGVRESTQVLKSALTRPDLDLLIAASRQQLADESMPTDRRIAVRLNLAIALTDRQALGDDQAGLLEAADILSDLLTDPAVTPATRYLVAMQLSGTKSMLASIAGSDEGWEQALDSQMALAERLPDAKDRRSAVMRAHDERAQFHMFRLERIKVGTEGEFLEDWDRELDAAIDCVQRALAEAPPDSEMRPDLLKELGAFISLRDPEGGVQPLRAAHRMVRRRPLPRRESVQLTLAMQLVSRARIRDGNGAPAEQVEADLTEAQDLATEVAQHGQFLAGQAAGLLAEISRYRAARPSM